MSKAFANLALTCALIAAPFVTIGASSVVAQDASAVARFQAGGFDDTTWGKTRFDMDLSQGVPWRVFTLTNPNRLVFDFKEVDFTGADAGEMDNSSRINAVRLGPLQPGWSRLIAELDVPLGIDSSSLAIDPNSGTAKLSLNLSKVDQPTFAASADLPISAGWALPDAADVAQISKDVGGPLVVVLDPGHGGIDPGAEKAGVSESELMLQFARGLRDVLVRAGGYQVYMTRDSDHFVSLEGRVSVAHRMNADLFVSLHADALAKGQASGAAIYTLAEEASDAASAALAERHDRTDLLIGLDLSQSDDQVAQVLLDLARQDNGPRSKAAAEHVLAGIKNAVGKVHKHPLREAGFSVLKSADIPSILIELGFLSTQTDLNNLQDPVWRAAMAAGIRDGITAWALEDAALARLRRH